MLVTKRQNKKWKLRVQSRVFAWKESLCEGLTKKGQLNIDSMEKSVKEMTYINIVYTWWLSQKFSRQGVNIIDKRCG
jgi:hypothetical protein